MVVKLVVLGEDKNRLPILDYQEAVIIMALSDAALKNAKPRDKKYTISDTGGLSIEVKPNRNKLWRFRYTYNGERKWMSFGPYPEVSLKKKWPEKNGTRQECSLLTTRIRLKKKMVVRIGPIYQLFETLPMNGMI